ncbi:efflux RND transporter periplasmic adaptor subunit [Staphylococcus sp. IVB6181]|uniref:efflux RND transporter periplasmic adaptor subunit n=1 Tax=Staphylococcus sp. IVB6181 TaxID=2929481 RepID=UPI0021CFA9CF|nr:efflux RND transporter periplasmic adaptor subunit [Staphylococcus sp. IVB6181]UXV35423.1 efflux RND transporter periplasmic adaptor subunit [Staphylococcus sp. IVB6181]
MKKKLIWIASIIAAVLVLFIVAVIVKNATGTSNSEDTYQVFKVKKESPLTMQGKASPETVKSYKNNSSIGDYINTTVSDGQEVEKGQQIITYNTNNHQRQSLVNKVNEAEQARQKAQEAVNRAPNDTQANQQLSDAQSQLDKANQSLNQLDNQINDSLFAAFDGKIEIEQDENPNEGDTILQLISKNPQIKTTVSEYDLSKIKEGQKVEYTVSSTGKKGFGEILKISELPTNYEEQLNSGGMSGAAAAQGGDSSEEGMDTAQASNPVVNDISGKGDASDASKYTVLIGQLSSPVRPGLSLDAAVTTDKVKLPSNVLGKDNTVYVLNKDNKVEKRKVKIEKQNGDIYVKSGVKTGERLVKHPKASLKNGDAIEVKQ